MDLVGFSKVSPQGMRPFWGCPNPLFLAPHPLFWGGESPHFSTFFVFFYIAFVFFFMIFAYFPHFLSNFLLAPNAYWQISGVICCVFRWSSLVNYAIICVKIPQWGIKMIKFIPHWGNFSEEFIPHWGIICIFAAVFNDWTLASSEVMEVKEVITPFGR